MSSLLRYRYLQPANGRYHYGRPDSEVLPPLRLVYTGVIPLHAEDAAEEVLDRLFARHAAPRPPGDARTRPAGVGDVLDLGEMGCWQVLSSGFRQLPAAPLPVEEAA